MNDAVIMTKYSRRKFFKKAARELLFSQWIMQVLAFLIVGGCCIGIDQFGVSVAQLVFYLFDNLRLAELFNVVYFVISVAVSIPLFYGLLYFEIGTVSGKANLADLFVAFSDISLLNRSYILFFYTFLKCLIFYLPALVLFLFLDWYYYNGIFGSTFLVFDVDIVRMLLSVLEVMLFYFAFVMTSKYFIGLYVSLVRQEKRISECFFVAKNCEFLCNKELAYTVISFFPLFVISLFTMGFLFLMYTIPYVVITLTMMSKFMFESEMSEKEIMNLMYDIKDTNSENND